MLRLFAVGVLATALFAGAPSLVAGGHGAPPARADGCMNFDAWYYTAGGAKTYVTPWAPGSCVGPTFTGWSPLTDPHASVDEDWLPTALKGAGFTSLVVSP
jgi:hypothetical protein